MNCKSELSDVLSTPALQKSRGMTNTRKILIVDDDAELREALVEQLALHEEFESIAVDNGDQGRAGGQGRADRSRDHGRRAARRRRARSRAHPAQERLQGADHHADRAQHRFRHHPRARIRRQRLRRQAVSLRRAARAHPRAAAPARGERGCRVHDRALYLPAELEDPAQPQGQQGPARRRRRPRSCATSIAPASARCRARRCCRRCGATIPASPPTRWKRTSTGCARRSRRTPPAPSILVTEAGGYKLVP